MFISVLSYFLCNYYDQLATSIADLEY